MRFFCLKAAAIATAALATIVAAVPAHADATDDALAAMRAASENYPGRRRRARRRLHPRPDEPLLHRRDDGHAADWGVMGIHYFRPDLLGVTATAPKVDGNGMHLDFDNPSILIYEPQADGSLELVAVENLVFEASWEAAGNDAPPTLLGRTWDPMADDPDTAADEAHGFAQHYDQHVWLFRDNPKGPLEPFNPNATCAHHRH